VHPQIPLLPGKGGVGSEVDAVGADIDGAVGAAGYRRRTLLQVEVRLAAVDLEDVAPDPVDRRLSGDLEQVVAPCRVGLGDGAAPFKGGAIVPGEIVQVVQVRGETVAETGVGIDTDVVAGTVSE
jgi:hypothetical protein